MYAEGNFYHTLINKVYDIFRYTNVSARFADFILTADSILIWTY